MPKRPMFLPSLIASLAAMSLAPCAQAVQIWHTDTSFAGQGLCSANFWFNSQMQAIDDLKVEVTVLDANGGEVQSGSLRADRLGDSPVDRYAQAALEGERLCEPGLSLRVDSATATIDGETVDLIATGQFEVRVIEPWPIHTD